MNKIFLLSVFSILLFFSKNLYSQEIEKISDKEEKQTFYQAMDYLNLDQCEAAIELFEKLIITNPDNYEIQFQLGYCYMHSPEKYKAVPILEKVLEYYKANPKGNEVNLIDAYYFLGRAYFMSYQFDMAEKMFLELRPMIKNKKLLKILYEQIELTKSAQELFNNPKPLVVTRLGIINTSFSEHTPVISADENFLYFTSKRGDLNKEKTIEGDFYENIYKYDKTHGYWTKPEPLPQNINLPMTHVATSGLSVDGQELYLYISDKKNSGNLYYSQLQGDKWTNPVLLDKTINSKKRETHASVSADGHYLYFTSDRRGGYGGLDIYVSEKQGDGTWGEAKNLGPNINTEKNEEGPFIHPDGVTLYFSSEGHKGMGGYDVFVSKKESGDWSVAKNLGFPLNTVDNDVFFVLTIDGKRAYYSSRQEGVTNIYIANISDEENNSLTLVTGYAYDADIKTSAFPKEEAVYNGDTLIIGNRKITKNYTYEIKDKIFITRKTENQNQIIITDSVCTVPPKVIISAVKLEDMTLDNNYSANFVTGKYLFVVPNNKDFYVYYEADGFLYDTKFIEKNEGQYNKIEYNAQLDPLVEGTVFSEKFLVFEPESAQIENRNIAELDILVRYMQVNEFLQVRFSTNEFYYEEPVLDDNRRTNAIDYLISNGISKDRISIDIGQKDYGKDTIGFVIFDEITKVLASSLSNPENLEVLCGNPEIYFTILENILNTIEKEQINGYREQKTKADELMTEADKEDEKNLSLLLSDKDSDKEKAEKKLYDAKKFRKNALIYYDVAYGGLYDFYVQKMTGVIYDFPEDEIKANELIADAEQNIFEAREISSKYAKINDEKIAEIPYLTLKDDVNKAFELYNDALCYLIQAIHIWQSQDEKTKQIIANDKKQWDNAQQDNSIASYQNYISKNPDGEYVTQAQRMIQQLKDEQLNELGQTNTKGLVYKVQICADRKPLSDNKIKTDIYKGDKKIEERFADGFYKYSIGFFRTYEEARILRDNCNVKGAFVVCFLDGKQIHITEGIKIENSQD